MSNISAMNYFPLWHINLWGMPNPCIMSSHKNLLTSDAVIQISSLASTHLVKQFVMTSKNLLPLKLLLQPYQVQSPLCEWPNTQYQMQVICWRVDEILISLACFTSTTDSFGMFFHKWPPISLRQCLVNLTLSSVVVDTPPMNLFQYSHAMGLRDELEECTKFLNSFISCGFPNKSSMT